MKDLKKLFEKINEDKENLKKKIQEVFTKLRNEINNREDILLMDVDKKFNDLFFKEDLIKEGDKLPNKIKNSLTKGKFINEHWFVLKRFVINNLSPNVIYSITI
jgi:hypothetical protein